jgi:CubicO group peptidase (beta-lactamase class C family)
MNMKPALTRRRFLANATKVAATVAATTLLPSPAIAAPQPGKHQRALAALDEYIREHMRAVGAPGMVVALAGRDGVLRVWQYGLADVKLRQPVRPQHLFEIGSISKSFAGICAVQLHEEGRLDLYAPVAKYLPELGLDEKYPPFNCHHLASHTSGLAHDAPLLPNGPLKKLWSGFAPGSEYSYSNTGYQILGMVLQTIEKRPWAEIVRDRVFRPLGFTSSEPIITSAIRGRLATGYSPLHDDQPFPPAGPLGEAAWADEVEASGSIAATGDDMAKYVLMLLNRGRSTRARVLSEEGFALFVKPVHKAESWGENTSYAYGLAVEEADNRTVLRHTGGMVAFSSAVHVDTTNGFGAFASVNASLERYRPNAVARYAINLLRASAKGEQLPAPPTASGDPPIKPADYVGQYRSSGGAEFSIEAVGDGVIMNRAGKRITLLPAGRDQFFLKDQGLGKFYLRFNREKDQVVEAFHGNGWYTNSRYAGASNFEYPKEWEAFAGRYRNDSPWWGSAQVFLRKGKLWLGDDPLVPLSGGLFRVGDEEYSPERVSFDGLSGGHALKMNFSGVDFYRRPEP